MLRVISLFVGAYFVVCAGVAAHAKPLELYIDADYTISGAAAEAIELGFRTALEEEDFLLGGEPVALVRKDHRANVNRSRRTFAQYLKSDRALAVIGGMHSPAYLVNREYLNDNRVLTLLPWSAAGPITRAKPGSENWIFRLSVDDAQSGAFFIRQSVERSGCERLAFVLLETGWGRANYETLTQALSKFDKEPVAVEFFPSAIGEASAGTLAESVARHEPDCAILLANWNDGALVVNALHARHPSLRIFSHWGIMGGDFPGLVPHETRDAARLSVLQTCGLRRETEKSPILASALRRAAPEVQSLAELPAPSGFVHGYDLARVLIAAAAQANQSGGWQEADISTKRGMLRSALRQLKQPVEGILNRYAPPFEPYSENAKDGHEALGVNDLCLARFREDGLLADAN